jgi:hypothetical protein
MITVISFHHGKYLHVVPSFDGRERLSRCSRYLLIGIGIGIGIGIAGTGLPPASVNPGGITGALAAAVASAPAADDQM